MTTVAGAAVPDAVAERSPLPDVVSLVDLHLGPAELARLLAGAVERGDALNAFLFAAGLRQIVEDELEPDVLRLAQIARILPSTRGGPAVALRSARAAAAAVRRAGDRRLGALRRFDARLGALADTLADHARDGLLPPGEVPGLAVESAALGDGLPQDAAFLARTLRPPACFRGFDQHPDDVERLADRFAVRHPDRRAPVAVLGLRTSGSYLGPLAAAALRRRGYAATALTTRPALPLPGAKRRALREVLAAGGLVVLIDDPPGSGGSVEAVATEVERLGGDRWSVVLMLALFEDQQALPPALAERPAVLLPWSDWSVHRRLEPAAVQRALAPMLEPEIKDVERAPLDDTPGRGHVSAHYVVTIEHPGEDALATAEVFVRGAGVGYLGEHACVVAERLSGWAPRVHGVHDGLLYREWLPGERRVAALDPEDVAGYAALRRDLFALPRDDTGELKGQDPMWEAAGALTARAFGRASSAMRLIATDRAMRGLLRTAQPSVVDGWMAADAFFRDADGIGLVKSKADERAFSNRDLACRDAAFDAAAAAAWNDLDAPAVRRAFERSSGERVDPERWLVYELVALELAAGEGIVSRSEADRRSARAQQRYFASLYLDDLPRGDGPFCAIDIDGVLETETLGFPGLSPAGALALRGLIAHGHRPLLASGRSIGEVAERCRAYGLAGGVAEYGAALYRTDVDTAESLITPAAAAAIERARAALAARPDVHVGGDHEQIVRASRIDSSGRRRALDDDSVQIARAAAAPVALRPVVGECQTDLVPAEVDKATGLMALTARLEHDPRRRAIALGVGDAVADLPMLALAERALAPGNADAHVRAAGVRVLRRGYQRGLAQAAGHVIGHAPGSCATCSAPEAGVRRKLLLAVLGARERGTMGMVTGAFRVLWLGRRVDRAG